MTEFDHPAPEVQALATLLHLARRAREAADAAELGFIAVNETHALAPYRQAALWQDQRGVTALSGVVAPEANAPYVQWLQRVFRSPALAAGTPAPRVLAGDDLAEAARAEWHEWLPAQALWLPMPRFRGALLLARDEPWTEAEQALLAEWVAALDQSAALLAQSAPAGPLARLFRPARTAGGQPSGVLPRPRTLALAAAAIAILCLPVHLTVLAPAELVPLAPAIVRAPLDGVVERIQVLPNQSVRAGDPLFEFDRANLQNRLQIALRARATVEAEYRQKAQLALYDSQSKTQLAILQGQIAEKATEVAYLRKLNERGMVLAPRDGVVLFDDPTEWTGRPVVTGERVMMVADAHAVEIEGWLSPGDAIPLAEGAPVTLYLNADPLRPLAGRLRYVGHEAMERPDGKYAYRVRATLVDDGRQPRVGLKGTAKLEGGRVSLAYWMLRRPLAATRAWLGV